MFFIMAYGTNSASAAAGISIYINGEKQSFSNQAVIENGSTLVPLRGIFESLGANVQWNQPTQTIESSKGNTKVWLKIGSKNAKVDGNVVSLSVPAQVKNGKTLVPLRFISESLGANVEWNQKNETVTITGDSKDSESKDELTSTDQVSYLKDISKSYKYKILQSEYLYTFKKGENGSNYWYETRLRDGEINEYIEKETEDGLTVSFADVSITTTIPYPLYLNKSWKDRGYTLKVTSLNKTVTTKAGTFKDCVEVLSNDGVYIYFAEGVGIVKQVYQSTGNTWYELVDIQDSY